MNIPAMPDITKEELWLIACNLAIEVEKAWKENSELRTQLAKADETIQSLEVHLALPKKTPSNSSLPPSAIHKSRCETGKDKPRAGIPGHVGLSRSRQEPDLVIDCRPEQSRTPSGHQS